MNIWEAYCTAKYYNYYFLIQGRKYNDINKANDLKGQYQALLQRFKESPFAAELKEINESSLFLQKLKLIFEDKWSGYLKYTEMPSHFYNYLSFLDSVQAIYGDYISPDWSKSLLNFRNEINDKKLSLYEKNYMIDGKLFALMNPYLLYILKKQIEEYKSKLAVCANICKDFYGDLIPSMTLKDYKELINLIWKENRHLQGNRRRDRIKITFPTGEEQLLYGFDALKAIVDYYSFEKVFKRKILVRDFPLLITQSLKPDESRYKNLDGNHYINYTGNMKDHLKTAHRINIDLGGELKIDQVTI